MFPKQDTREPMLRWLAAALETNAERSKTIVSEEVAAPDGFFANLNSVLLTLCQPFLEPSSDLAWRRIDVRCQICVTTRVTRVCRSTPAERLVRLSVLTEDTSKPICLSSWSWHTALLGGTRGAGACIVHLPSRWFVVSQSASTASSCFVPCAQVCDRGQADQLQGRDEAGAADVG